MEQQNERKNCIVNGRLSNNDAWTKKVGIKDGALNFWEGNYNCYIIVDKLNLETFFSKSATDVNQRHDGRKSGELSETASKAFIVPTIKGYNFTGSWVTLHSAAKLSAYANLAFTFAHEQIPKNDKGQAIESFSLNIHLLTQSEKKKHTDECIADISNYIQTINEKLKDFAQKFETGEIKELDKIKQYRYEQFSFNFDTNIFVPKVVEEEKKEEETSFKM